MIAVVRHVVNLEATAAIRNRLRRCSGMPPDLRHRKKERHVPVGCALRNAPSFVRSQVIGRSS